MEKRSRAMRIGIAGLGAGAVNALAATPGLTNHPNIQLVAAADLRPEARDAFASRYGGRTHAGVEEMCKASDIDAVYILTPNALHAEHAIIAAEHGKQVIADKPMALTLDDCDAMIRAAERNGVRLLIGHSQSLDGGILKMIEIIRSGVLGRPIMIASNYYNDWLYRPRSRDELDPSTLEGSLVLRQGAVQLDIVRMLGGGMVRSVHGTTIVADPARRVEGAYAAYLEFEDGTPATVAFDAHGHFDSAELTYGIGLNGRPRDREFNLGAHRQARSFATQEDEYAFKNATRLGGGRTRAGPDAPATKHQFFGLTIVSCERGAMRQSPDGIMIHSRDAWYEQKFAPHLYTEIELDLMYRAWANDEPLEYCDGPWGKATTETCLGLIRSAVERREIYMEHQVRLPADRRPLRPE
jgi:phthalate 4,5-cis-dihydrodiol dehydrogenase